MKKLITFCFSALLFVWNSQATDYFSQVSGIQDMSILSNWNSNPGGTGSAPSNFTTSGDKFIVQSSHAIISSANLTFGAGVNFQIDGYFNPSASSLTVGGTTSVLGSGSYTDGNSGGVNTFTGLVTINTTDGWYSTSTLTAANYIFSGGITNLAGSFICGAATLASGTTITPTAAMNFDGEMICPGNLIIADGQLVSNTLGTSVISGNFTIGTGGFTKTATFLTINGNVICNGPWDSEGVTGNVTFKGNITNNSSSTFKGGQTFFDPTGTNLNIAGTGAFSFKDAAVITAGKTVTNLCTNVNGVDILGSLNGQNATSEWINGANTLLKYSTLNSIVIPMPTGKLTSTANGSFLEYSRPGDQQVRGGTYANIRINKGSTKTCQGIVSITQTLDLVHGFLKSSGPYYPFMRNNSTTSLGNDSSFVENGLRYEMAFAGTRTLNLPIGKDPDWRPVQITVTHSTATAYAYRGRLINNSAAALGYTLPGTVSNVSLAHYWDMSRLLVSTGKLSGADLVGNSIIKIYYGANDNVQDPSNLTICKNNQPSSTQWYDIGGTGASVGTGSVTSTSSPTAFTDFSHFTLGNKNGGGNPLPVKLVSFVGSCNNGMTKLEWTTASEVRNDFFTVESSYSGLNWKEEKIVKGAGTSNQLRHYEALIPASSNTSMFYRLKQTDFDGSFDYSEPIRVTNCTLNDNVKVFPNPTDGIVNVTVSGDVESVNAIKIYNVMGNMVYETNGFERQINLKHLSKGVYYAHIIGNKEEFVQQILLR